MKSFGSFGGVGHYEGLARELEETRAFQQAQQCQEVSSIPAMDWVVNEIHDEVIRYWNNLQGLISRLESPRPVSCGSDDKRLAPATIGEALRDIHDNLVNCNDVLQATNRRIDEQVGELKLLP